MLKVPRLDDLDYNQLFERARNAIPTLTDQWTDLNYHDPGITTLQTFAWLYDSLNYYMNATGDVHRRKYLKLLGINSNERPAKALLALEGDGVITLPKGSRFKAGDISFETDESFNATANKLISLYSEVGGKIRNLTPFAGVDGGFSPVFTMDDKVDSSLYLGFKEPLSGECSIYIQLEDSGRNPFVGNFLLGDFSWSYYFEGAWKKAELILDDTSGFLRSGFVSLYISEKMSRFGGGEFMEGYYLKCELKDSNLDAIPRVGKILPSSVMATQKRSWASTTSFIYDGEDSKTPDIAIRETDYITILVYDDDDYYSEYYRHSVSDLDKCSIERLPNNRVIINFIEKPEIGSEVVVMILSEEAAPLSYLGKGDGCGGQRLFFDAENISHLRLAVSRVDDKGRMSYQFWNRCEDLATASPNDKTFYFDIESSSVIFGDNINGVCPDSCDDIWAVEIETSYFGDGNVVANQIKIVEPIENLTSVYNPDPAYGGESHKSIEALELEIDKKVRGITRAVTSADYSVLVKETPGLMIDSLNVISMRDYCDYYDLPYTSNTVLLAVKPQSNKRLATLSKPYRDKIIDHLENYRLLTTDIRIIPVRYVGISVYGRIKLADNIPNAARIVEKEIARGVETIKTGEYGKGADVGELFSILELCEAVKSISQLSLEYIGDGGKKNHHEDVVVGPDALCYLREIGIEYI